jgi:hypothetical protein
MNWENNKGMCIKKIMIKVSVGNREELDTEFVNKIEQEFPFIYTPLTKINTLLRLAYKKCQLPCEYAIEHSRFMVRRNGELLWLDERGRITRLNKYVGRDGRIELEYLLADGIGGGLDKEDGICFFYHTKELRHAPHIHAKYQGEEISIDILTQKVKGKFKNKKKQRQVVDYVIKNQQRLLDEYNNKTNGIRVWGFEI